MSGPSTRRATASVRSSSSSVGSGASFMGMRSLARKFWTMTSCTWPQRSCRSRMANSASTRSRGVSPIPMRMPVVKGMPSLPARPMVRRRRGRHLVGRVVVRVAPREQTLGQRLQHDAHADVDLAQRGQIALAHEPGIGVGQERRLLQRELAHRAQIAERGAMPVAREELAVLGRTAPPAGRPARTAPPWRRGGRRPAPAPRPRRG